MDGPHRKLWSGRHSAKAHKLAGTVLLHTVTRTLVYILNISGET